jgi:hypothetical protein
MSLYDVEHVAEKLMCTVECCECDKVETIEVLESTTSQDLESHLCANCKEPVTLVKFHALVNQYYGKSFTEEFIKPFYHEFLDNWVKLGSKVNTVYGYIQELNLNDQKARGI